MDEPPSIQCDVLLLPVGSSGQHAQSFFGDPATVSDMSRWSASSTWGSKCSSSVLFAWITENLPLQEVSHFDKAVELRPQSFDVYIARADFNTAIKKLNEAYEDYTRALDLNPGSTEIYTKRAQVAHLLRDFNSGIQDLDSAISITPADHKLYAMRAHIKSNAYDSRSDTGVEWGTAAIVDLDTALSIDPLNADYYDQRGVIKFELGRNLDAMADFNRAIELNPKNPETFNNRGLVKMKIEDYKSANSDFGKAIELSPDKEYYFRNRGLTRFNAGKHKMAITDYTRAIQLIISQGEVPADGVNFKLTNAHLIRGMSYVAIKNNFAGCKDFYRAAELGETKAKNYLRRYCNNQ